MDRDSIRRRVPSDWSGVRRYVPARVRRSYLAKFAVVVAVIAAATVAVGLVSYQDVSAELTDNVHEELTATTELEASELRTWLQSNQRSTRMLSSYAVFRSNDTTAIRGQLDTELGQLPESTRAIHYVDLNSKEVLVSTDDDVVGRNLSNENIEWMVSSFDMASSSTVAISEVYLSGMNEQMAFVSRIKGTSKAVMLVVDPTTRAQQFSSTVNGSSTRVVSGDGMVAFAENDTDILTEYGRGANATVVQVGTLGGSGVFEANESAQIVAYAAVPGTDWVVVKHAPTSNAYALRQAVGNDFLILFGVALLGFVFVGATIGRNTVRSLNVLRDNAQALARGDLSVEVPDTDRVDEVGQALEAFDDTHAYLDTVAAQADALAKREFDAPVLDEDVPGDLGRSLATMRADLDEFVTELESTRSEAREAREEAERLADSLEATAEEFSALMAEAADGDLTRRLDADTDSEAMAAIADAFNAMLADLAETVVEIQEFAETVAASSEQVSASATEVETASEDVSESVQRIADDAAEQDRTLAEAIDQLTEMSATIEEVASSADEVAATMSEAADLGEAGTDAASEAVTEMDVIERRADEVVTEVESLHEEMQAIGEVAELIDDIAEQTNVLALNASIEAARAGEAGEGFAVVANEVKGLAEQTQEATEEIEARIGDVQSTTAETVDDVTEMRERVGDGIETVDRTVDRLEDIVAAVENANATVQSINDATDEQASTTEEVVAQAEEVGEISERTAERAQDAAASAEEQTATISEVTEAIGRLSERSQDLEALLDDFDVEFDDETTTVDDTLDEAGVATADDATPEATDVAAPDASDDPAPEASDDD
jgi:methyl-accepting chemotaxis protein